MAKTADISRPDFPCKWFDSNHIIIYKFLGKAQENFLKFSHRVESDWIRLLFARSFQLNSGAPIASTKTLLIRPFTDL